MRSERKQAQTPRGVHFSQDGDFLRQFRVLQQASDGFHTNWLVPNRPGETFRLFFASFQQIQPVVSKRPATVTERNNAR